MSKYAEIIERLEMAVDGSDSTLDHLIMDVDPGPRTMPWNYASSLDASMALVERMAPTQWPTVLRTAISDMANEHAWHICYPRIGQRAELPIKILLALFRTLEAKERAG